MGYELEKFNSGTMDKGLSIRSMDFQGEIVLGFDSYNMTQGIQQGLGPRYGISIIPGQMSTEAPDVNNLQNMQCSEGVTDAKSLFGRKRCYGIATLKLPDPSDVSKRITVYAFIFSAENQSGSGDAIEISFAATNGAGTTEVISTDIRHGFYRNSTLATNVSSANTNVFGEGITSRNLSRVVPLQEALALPGSGATLPSFISWTAGVAGGGDISTQWLLGGVISNQGDATHAPNVILRSATFKIPFNSGTSAVNQGGIPSEYNLQNFRTTQRAIKVFALKDTAELNILYSATFLPSTTILVSDINNGGSETLVLSGVTATKDSAGTTYTDTKAALVYDDTSTLNSGYKAVLMASNGAYACLFQDGWRSQTRRTNQWYDLTQNSFQVQIFPTQTYVEDGVGQKTCFYRWSAFARGTPMTATFTGGPQLSAANTGILRSNTVYEFTYSLYNKRLNSESNVGRFVKIQTGDDDFVGIQLFDAATVANPGSQYFNWYSSAANNHIVPYIFGNFQSTLAAVQESTNNFINFCEYRFYYRPEGSYEWLPALSIDASKFWFHPSLDKLTACAGPFAGSTGGQPGAFNDYSVLPKDKWIDTKIFKNRAFWCSPTQIQFSLYNNFFAYPGRNSAACPSGEFRGMLLHNYPGQAEQNSRLIIFGSVATYVGRFTGDKLQTVVQVSPDATGLFDIDGSDFVIDTWTSDIAFSWRSAIVAQGILYWWGPQGIYRDDGVQTPTKISMDLEPDIFTLFDHENTAAIHASYNDQTKEIIWFYYPRVTDGDGDVRHGLVYNVISGNFTRTKFYHDIDWSQSLLIESNPDTAGARQVIGAREAANSVIQRAYFFDQRNRSGDMAPDTDFVVKQVSTPSTGVRRLTLAAGFDPTNLATIAVGDLIALQQTKAYSGLTNASDMIATINAINAGSGTIDINLPTGAALDTGSLTIATYFPIWHATRTARGLNGIPYKMSTNYWLPSGVNGYYFWLYCYLLAKMDIWPSSLTPGWTFGYRTPTSLALATDQIPFEDNSDGNFQVYHPLRPLNDNMEGQGLKFVLSGTHLGNEWVLQYMEIHGTLMGGDTLKRFEG